MWLICTGVKNGKIDAVEAWVKEKLGRKVYFEAKGYKTVFCQMELFSISADISRDEYKSLCSAALEAMHIEELGVVLGYERSFGGD